MNQSALYQVAEVELIYKSKVRPSERPVINDSKDVYKILMKNWDVDTIELFEQFKIILLNRKSKVLGICEISSGGIHGTITDIRLIFSAALKAAATRIILCHNHPSGNSDPSQLDRDMTEKIKQAGLILEIKVVDHVIITNENYYSFADEGML